MRPERARITFDVAVLLVLAGVLSLATGCGKEQSASTAQRAKPVQIGVSLLTQQHIFYQDLERAMRDAAAEHGFKLFINYSEFDLAKHADHVDNYLVRGVDAIVICPADSEGIAATIEKANAARVPVFTADIAAHGGEVVSHIASDNVQGGREAGTYIARLLGGTGKIAIIDNPEAQSVQARVQGFKEVIATYPEIEIVADVPGYAVRDRAMAATEDVLQGYPELDGIFGINDDSALGALAAVEAAGKQNRILIVGYDAVPEARQAILKGTALKADVVQHPEKIGRQTIDTVAKHLKGDQVEPWIPVEVGIVDKASLEAEAAERKS